MGGGGWGVRPDPEQDVVSACDQVERWAAYVVTSTEHELSSVMADFNELRIRIAALGQRVEAWSNYVRRQQQLADRA